eukprot:1629542-Pleurochrysis_carterae.AAC.1
MSCASACVRLRVRFVDVDLQRVAAALLGALSCKKKSPGKDMGLSNVERVLCNAVEEWRDKM